MAGYYNHDAATDYYCIDKDPEDILGGTSNVNGYVLYFVEAACGSLRCPPLISMDVNFLVLFAANRL